MIKLQKNLENNQRLPNKKTLLFLNFMYNSIRKCVYFQATLILTHVHQLI